MLSSVLPRGLSSMLQSPLRSSLQSFKKQSLLQSFKAKPATKLPSSKQSFEAHDKASDIEGLCFQDFRFKLFNPNAFATLLPRACNGLLNNERWIWWERFCRQKRSVCLLIILTNFKMLLKVIKHLHRSIKSIILSLHNSRIASHLYDKD